MEKKQFLLVVQNYTSITEEEAAELISATGIFPYSQILRNLCSRASQDLNLNSRESYLHASAVYTTERSVLKAVMTAPRVQRSVKGISDVELPVATAPAKVSVAQDNESILTTPDIRASSGDTLRNNLTHDLELLKKAMSNFERTMEALDKGIAFVPPEEPKKKAVKRETEPADSLIEEIKSTKKKVKPDGPKQKEQIEIIENFIKTQPTITKNKLNAMPVDDSDLAEQSLVSGDNIVSETLVEILLKQGKKDKAIEVLKKLIWKIPQKKAYFAAQIEELKK